MVYNTIVWLWQDFIRHAKWNIWCDANNWKPIERCVKSSGGAPLKLFHRWQPGEVDTILVIPHCTVVLQQLFKIFDYPQRSNTIMAENQFQGHQDCFFFKGSTVPVGARACTWEKKLFFFLIIVSLFLLLWVISQQHQRARRESAPDPHPVRSC